MVSFAAEEGSVESSDTPSDIRVGGGIRVSLGASSGESSARVEGGGI